ncbi:unnamed protein product [Rotaria magnacalcarata]|uniref:Uncharacterized protein n=1 Tax=Rotaria magnacalcarata TaxID=392030 RepID=A0A816AXI0_9BILA|nr:unnamed protein product [Rotaria magnacalcarata]CAF1603012.1 unnamed protein product [Rotaria magnacalcarata]CAF3923777.1 unnamed protein product [Rotaria magnacalcarata]CAF4044902.1 unnamed protein product [Rotaria magnacalcarata]
MKLTLKKVPDRGLDIRTWNEINSDDKVCKYPPSYYDNLCQYPNRQISMALLLIVYDNDDECQQIYVHDQSIYIQTQIVTVELNRYSLFLTRSKRSFKEI